MKDTDNINRRRNEYFLKICLEIIRAAQQRGETLTARQVVDMALSRRPPCHFATYDHARKVLSRIFASETDTLREDAPMRQHEWLELARQVKDEIETRHLPFNKALSFVLNFRRPTRFYLSTDTAMRILRPHVRRNITLIPV